MKFYQENKINPLASCLPLLMQLPVFISLFYMLRTDLKFDICGPQLPRPLRGCIACPESTMSKKSPAAQVPGALSLGQVPVHARHHRKATGVALIVLIVLYVGSQLARR